MRFEILATDYDGTLAHHGLVDPPTLEALERLRASGRRALLVTGREIEDLRLTFSRFDLFDIIVAENGAVLYYPSSGEFKLLHDPPPKRFADALREAGIKPLSVGHVIVATQEPNDGIVGCWIKELGVDLEIICNKGSVMVLPAGVNKATGLAVALQECGVSPQNTVAVGDAENDHPFLNFCGFAVAVNNALPSLKEHADFVTCGSQGRGVAELIDLMISTDLSELTSQRSRLVSI